MAELALVVMFAILVEAIIEIVSNVVGEDGLNVKVLVSIIISVALTVAFNLDALAMFGFVSPVPLMGSVLTGIVISRGSNFVSDLFSKLQSN